jgi:hypothetical protein
MAIQTVNGGCVHIEVLVPIADPDDEKEDDD